MVDQLAHRPLHAPFSERLLTRSQLWWELPRPGTGQTLADAVHRLRERRMFHTRRDPADAWHCCRFWPRNLINKWNGREFAARHGFEVPGLYWQGSDLSSAPLESLPGAFVIRPVFGTSRRGVSVMRDGIELLTGRPRSLAELRANAPRTKALRPAPVLIEEFIGSDDCGLPLEFKAHVFGSRVAAIDVVNRPSGGLAKSRYYTPDWEPYPELIDTSLELDQQIREPPRRLEQLLELLQRLGTEIGTYMRIDFFLKADRWVFNEFSSVPGMECTPYGDELFGSLWAETFPDAT